MECYSSVLGNVFAVVKGILSLIQIVGPILCMISLTYTFIMMLKDPEDKKYPKRIKNSAIALVLLFFIPVIINIFLGTIIGDTDIGNCYRNASFNKEQPTYINPHPKK